MKITHAKCSLQYNQIHGELHNCVLVMASSLQVVSVGKMLAWWMLLIILLILEGGASTIGGDVPEHQDIPRIEDRWKEYRGIGKICRGNETEE